MAVVGHGEVEATGKQSAPFPAARLFPSLLLLYSLIEHEDDNLDSASALQAESSDVGASCWRRLMKHHSDHSLSGPYPTHAQEVERPPVGDPLRVLPCLKFVALSRLRYSSHCRVK